MITFKETKVLLNSTDISQNLQDPGADTEIVALTTGDALYLGSPGKFTSRHFNFSVLNTTPSVISVKIWDGTSFIDVSNLEDGTDGFTGNGFMSWDVPKDVDWVSKEQTGYTSTSGEDSKLYWAEITVSADLDAGTAVQSIINIYSDDEMLKVYYPDIVDDSRYLPPGQTDFLRQHQAAKDLIVLRLRQRRVITQEDQVIDRFEYAEAGVHGAARIILMPIEPVDSPILARAEMAFQNEVNQLVKSIDANRDGKVSDEEKYNYSYTSVVRR